MASLGAAFPLFPFSSLGTMLGSTPAVNLFSLDAADDYLAWVFTAPANGPVFSRAAIRLGVRTGTSPVYRLSLQGVDANGYPDGMVKGGASPVSVTLNPSTGGGTVQEYTFANPYDSSPGEKLALVVEYSSGTIGIVNCWSFTRGMGAQGQSDFPYSVESNSGNKTFRTTQCFGLYDGTNWFGAGLMESSGQITTVGSNPVSAGNLFTLPAAMGESVSCVGMWHFTNISLTALRGRLYSGDSLLAETDWWQSANTYGPCFAYWDDGPQTLICGQPYRIVMTTSSDTTRVFYYTVTSAAHMTSMPFGGMVYYTQGAAGSWVDTTTRRAMVGILIDDITAPSGGGGGGGPVIGSRIIRGLGAL